MVLISTGKLMSLTRRVLLARVGAASASAAPRRVANTAPHFRGFAHGCEFTDEQTARAADMAGRLRDNARWMLLAGDFYEALAARDGEAAARAMGEFRATVPVASVPESSLLRVMTGDARLALEDCESA